MKIQRVSIYATEFDSASYSRLRLLRKGPKPKTQDTVVVVETDNGLVGFGETCPLPPNYLPSTSASARGGLNVLAPSLLGQDPRGVRAVYDRMDELAFGVPEAKTAIDMACWDILGKATGLPCHLLFGGRRVEQSRVFESVTIADPAAMVDELHKLRAAGISVFQVKIGEGADPDLERIRALVPLFKAGETALFDVNRGWLMQEARRGLPVLERLADGKDIWIEQPGTTYEECKALRQHTSLPILLDEVIDNIHDLRRAIDDRTADGVVIKVAHAGGPTRALEMIRLALGAGLKVRIEDTTGTDLVRAAVAHISCTVPARSLIASYSFPESSHSLGSSETQTPPGFLRPGDGPGLGVQVDVSKLGEPLAVFG